MWKVFEINFLYNEDNKKIQLVIIVSTNSDYNFDLVHFSLKPKRRGKRGERQMSTKEKQDGGKEKKKKKKSNNNKINKLKNTKTFSATCYSFGTLTTLKAKLFILCLHTINLLSLLWSILSFFITFYFGVGSAFVDPFFNPSKKKSSHTWCIVRSSVRVHSIWACLSTTGCHQSTSLFVRCCLLFGNVLERMTLFVFLLNCSENQLKKKKNKKLLGPRAFKKKKSTKFFVCFFFLFLFLFFFELTHLSPWL
ncbi:hypothetical protein RFI_26928 [Reticulomyxa filosa]|uniref:Uncharacterized protein n=1 Tax=Reticulomyxa filosa TaxID=46433 RepID=X6MAG3_RETFI|nr:hypothetical protein RFI_26928 [Reticulomyxa filosa]|eukprot:ETO10447.1 hypothetical protein RFI_26928 [Reticulomyxa filosa]